MHRGKEWTITVRRPVTPGSRAIVVAINAAENLMFTLGHPDWGYETRMDYMKVISTAETELVKVPNTDDPRSVVERYLGDGWTLHEHLDADSGPGGQHALTFVRDIEPVD